MANTRQNDWRKGIRKEANQRRNNIKTIKIERKGDKEQEVNIGHETVPKTKEKSTWSWYEEFAFEWSEAFITNERKKYPRKGE